MRKQVAIQLVVSNLYTVMTFALTIILARLLTPEDIGVFSMSAVLISIAHVFRDFGLTAFLKREKELTDQVIRTAKGILYLTSTFIAAVMYISAPSWSAFYGEARVEEVIRILALGFLFIPFGSIPYALISREMDAVKNGKVAILSVCVYFVTSIVLAILGFGHTTMAWANFVNIVFSGLANNLILGRKLPLIPSLKGWKQMVSFGLGNVLTSLAKTINTAIPEMMLGRLSNATYVGLISRANATVNMVGKVIEGPINFFTLPYIARIHHQAGDIGRTYLRLSSLINTIMLPPLIWVAIMAEEIILFLFGPAWRGAVPAVPWLCVAIAISTLFSISTQTVMGVGRPYAALAPVLISVAGKIVAIFALYNGTLSSFSMAIAFGEILSIPAFLWMLKKYIDVDLVQWTVDLVKLATIALAIYGIVTIGATALKANQIPTLVTLLATGFTALFSAMGAYFVLRLPVAAELRELINKLRLSARNK